MTFRTCALVGPDYSAALVGPDYSAALCPETIEDRFLAMQAELRQLRMEKRVKKKVRCGLIKVNKAFRRVLTMQRILTCKLLGY